MSLLRLLTALKGGAGSGNFGHSGRPGKVGGSGSGGVSVSRDRNLSAAQLQAKGYIPVYRGTGKEGLAEIRPSSEGMMGPGVYFYDSPIQAAPYAERGGGIITGFVHPSQAVVRDINLGGWSIPHRIVVVPDASNFIRRGNITTDESLDMASYGEGKRRTQELVNRALDER